MREEPVIAVIGAGSLVGMDLVAELGERKFAASEVRLFDSEDRRGEIVAVCGDEVVLEAWEEAAFQDVDIAFCASTEAVAAALLEQSLAAGAYAIDAVNCSLFQGTEAPVVVSYQVNPQSLEPATRLYACPHPVAAQLLPVLALLHQEVGLKRVSLATYQGVGGAGQAALDELWEQSRSVFSQQGFESVAFQHQIAFNCIPHIDVFLDDGATREERRILAECRQILGLPQLPMAATAVRVPVFHGNAAAVQVETEREMLPETLTDRLSGVEQIEILPSYSDYPMHLTAAGSNCIHIGRLRRDTSVPHGLSFWTVADGLKAGSAYNAVRLAEIMTQCFV